jgi:hypothetical protein
MKMIKMAYQKILLTLNLKTIVLLTRLKKEDF